MRNSWSVSVIAVPSKANETNSGFEGLGSVLIPIEAGERKDVTCAPCVPDPCGVDGVHAGDAARALLGGEHRVDGVAALCVLCVLGLHTEDGLTVGHA